MRFPSRAGLCAAASGLFLLLMASPAHAAETAASDIVVIPENDVVTDDLYAVGSRVLVEGRIEGDLTAFATEEVVITGEVTGSVLALAPTVTISGDVGGSVRFSANRLTVSGSVSGDVVGAAVTVELGPESRIDGDVLIWAVRMSATGTVGADLEGSQRTLELAGSVGGDVDVSVNRLVVTGPLDVTGDLGYRSQSEAEGLDQATVGGVVAHKTPLPANLRIRALGIVTRFLVVLGLTAAALLVGWGWSGRTDRAAQMVRTRPWRALGSGALVMLSPVIVAGIAALAARLAPPSASLPLLAIFGPLIVALLGVVFVLALVAGAPAALALGRAFPRGRGMYGSILVGSLLAGAIWLIPYVGWLVPALMLPIGLGAWLLSSSEEELPPSSHRTA